MMNYAAQKNYLKKQKQLRVWVNAEKYDAFRHAVESQGTSVYAVINQFVDSFLERNREQQPKQ